MNMSVRACVITLSERRESSSLCLDKISIIDQKATQA